MIILGNKMYERCPDCGSIVCLNKWLFGSLHICLAPEEKARPNRYRHPSLNADLHQRIR